MKLRQIELTDFRNIAHAKLAFNSQRIFFVGENAQGKTNILEAIALAQGLGSFRTHQREPMIRSGQIEAVVRQVWQHEKIGEITVGASLTAQKQKLMLGNEPLRGATKIIGTFPMISMALSDRELIYGGPEARRNEMDRLIAQIDPAYNKILSSYNKALRSRNALLGNPDASPAELEGFEVVMQRGAVRIIKSRQRICDLISELFETALESFAPQKEYAQIQYCPNTPPERLAQLWADLRQNADRIVGYTTKGPHRDEFKLSLNGESVGLYGSEGQKFSVVLAWKIAGLRLLAQKLQTAPVLVCDDLLLELDSQRQSRFWESLGDYQVFASSTTLPPDPQNWEIYRVKSGIFSLEKHP